MESLVLNKSGTPIEIIPWQRAVTLIFEDRAVALVEYPGREIKSPNMAMLMPSVIQLTQSDYIPKRYIKQLPFNRKNVYLRDGGRCMYCGKKVGLSSFTFDHIYPQHLGGKSEWLNVVVACIRCNGKKGGKTLDRCGLELIRKPYVPTLDRAAPANLVGKIGLEIPHETWEDYIYWNITLLP